MTRTTTKPTAREQLRTMRAESLATAEQLELIAAEHAKECAAWGDIPGYMHTIRHGRLMIKALAKSAERLAAKFRSASARLPARREPSAGSRSYPTFTPGESTADYLARFATLNGQALGFQVLPYNLSAYLHPCTLYEGNALDFEPIEQPADAPELSADALQPVAIVSALTGATLGTVPRHVADQVAELIASATTAAEEARKAANRGKSIVERRADAVLSKEVRDSETGTVMTRAQWVERRVNDGARPSIEMVDKIKPMSRTQFNRASNAEQRAHEAKIKAGGKVPEYSLGDYIVSKTEYDYAQKLIASATTAAAIEQASTTETAHDTHQAPELATVGACSESSASATTCDASSASGTPSAPQNGRASSTQHQAPTKPTHDAYGQRIGQRVAGNSGHWRAVMFTDPDGRPSFEFDGPGGLIEVLTFTTGRERMAALQAKARQADQYAAQTARELRLNTFDAMTATAADVQAMGAEYVAQLLDDLEDINYHTEGLILQALAAGREDLAARARANLREHLAAGYLTDALRLDRQAIGEALRQSTEPDPTHPAGDTPSSDPTSAQGYAPPAPDAHQQTAPVPTLADKVPRAVGADSGPASNPPGATAPSAPAPSAPAPSAPAPAAEASADEPEPEFTRTAPQPFDMLAMIAAGLAPSDFVGLGIVYSGDMANPSGRGAITDVQPCSWYKYTVTVTLEDGRQSRLNPVSFTEHLGNRYRTDFKRHGAPYLAELAAARLAVEAADKAAKQAAADDKARQRRELPQQWPRLKAYEQGGKLWGCTLAAHNIRVLLKEKFPKVKFSVKSDKFSGGDSISIRWTDGPSAKSVEEISNMFEAGSFNGMEDIYEYSHSTFRDLFGDAKYIHVNRDHSDAAIAQAIEALYLNTEGRPTVEDYRKARGMFDYHENRGAIRRLEQRLDDMGDGFQK